MSNYQRESFAIILKWSLHH